MFHAVSTGAVCCGSQTKTERFMAEFSPNTCVTMAGATFIPLGSLILLCPPPFGGWYKTIRPTVGCWKGGGVDGTGVDCPRSFAESEAIFSMPAGDETGIGCAGTFAELREFFSMLVFVYLF
jgi:hypothetical protein